MKPLPMRDAKGRFKKRPNRPEIDRIPSWWHSKTELNVFVVSRPGNVLEVPRLIETVDGLDLDMQSHKTLGTSH